jgi:hypothetical protein
MDKKERVLSAIARKPVYRIPYNFRAEPDTQGKIYRHLGFHDYDSLLDFLNLDIFQIEADFLAEASLLLNKKFWQMILLRNC